MDTAISGTLERPQAPLKGAVHLGTCGYPTCTVQPATHWCHWGYYVCAGCAEDENRRTWRNRPDGEPCCTPIPPYSPAPKPVTPMADAEKVPITTI
jgi:hypothetical protein